LVGPSVRSYVLGRSFWFAADLSPRPQNECVSAASRIEGAVRAAFGDMVKTRSILVDETFLLSPAASAGASPLPPELASLIEDLAAGAPTGSAL